MAVTPHESPFANPSAWADPPLDCDVVMKRGITSGVVYPGAVRSAREALPVPQR